MKRNISIGNVIDIILVIVICICVVAILFSAGGIFFKIIENESYENLFEVMKQSIIVCGAAVGIYILKGICIVIIKILNI